jgi:hypothetical protein
LSWPKQLLALSVGALALFATHYVIDSRIGVPASQSVSNAFEHLENIEYSLRRAASLKGTGELLSIFGLFTLIPLVAYWLSKRRPARFHPVAPRPWHSPLGAAESCLLAVVAIHMLLSGDLGRMGFLAAPAFCSALALVFTHRRTLLPF